MWGIVSRKINQVLPNMELKSNGVSNEHENKQKENSHFCNKETDL